MSESPPKREACNDRDRHDPHVWFKATKHGWNARYCRGRRAR